MTIAETEFDLGNKCVIQKRFQDAISHYEESAQNGCADAQYNLGFCYSHGIGVKQNYLKATIWYNKAIANGLLQAEDLLNELKIHGNAETQYFCGFQYYFGIDVNKDYKQAVYWFTLAAKQEHVFAQYYLGVCYYNGWGTIKNYKQAVYWYTEAAQMGHDIAQYNLGLCYYRGEGVTKDYKQAVYWLTKAAEQDNIDAIVGLGSCYAEGKGVDINYKKAVCLYAKAAQQGHAYAQYCLAKCYEEWECVTNDYKQAEYWYRKAAEQGFVEAKNALNKILNKSNIKNLLVESNTEYSKNIQRYSKISFVIIKEYAETKSSYGNDELWASLNRGRAVLNSERQMYQYMHSYGNMHRAKLNEAFSCITKGVFANSEIEIIDYACGQGLASVCFKDYFQNVNVEHITLIEPSTICLRRAALHVLKSYSINENNISTINKYLDDLTSQDIYTNDGNIKVHLFSNILDMAYDEFSLNRLVDLIKNKFSGVNYFICVSPYIDDSVPTKFNTFLRSFDNVKILGNIDLQKGDWINNWAIVLRAFKVQL